jgi:dihydrofolate synthase / folylpolyglutamate synthase
MTYRETLEYLYAQLPMFHRIGPAAFKKDLTNTLALAAHLGNPHEKFPSIHVAGTNGKGSVSHLLAAACQAAGLKTGLYISPHYKDFRERIKVNGVYIPKRQVVDFVVHNKKTIEKIEPSFFELCVAMAFEHFARESVDIAIIEVGLGGRLDSTNIITPLLSVITNISYDHQNMLGDTLPLIAGEKAGIIKPGVPVVVGETQSESAPVFLKKASETNSPIFFADQIFKVLEKPSSAAVGILPQKSQYDVFKNKKPFLQNLELETAGPYQQKNLVTALQAWDLLRLQLPALKEPALRHGLKHLKSLTRFIGRWEIIGQNPTILCDSAHNEAGLKVAFEKIKTLNFKKLHIVTGFVNDKSVENVLGLFPKTARYYFAKADIPRGLDAAVLKEKAAAAGMQGRAYSTVPNALKAAQRAAEAADMIVVIGSIFVVAEVLRK